MGYPVEAGAANYSSTGANAGSNFIPQVWSSKLVEKFYASTVFGEIANTDYEGEIKSYGDEVVIRTVPSITVTNYVKGKGLNYQQPESPSVSLKIDQGKTFSFKLFDIDKKQSDINLMDEWAGDGAEQMKSGPNGVDKDILSAIPSDADAANAGNTAGAVSGVINLGSTATPLAVTKENIVDVLVDYGTILDEQNVPDANRWVVLPARMCALIKKSELKDASITGDNVSIVRNGRVGMIDRFTIYNSNNVNATAGKHDVVFGHKSALTFAGQIETMETLKDPDDFGDLARSLFVFGFETIKKEALGHSVCTLA